MFPEIFRIGPIPLNSYGFMIAVGFLTSIYFIQRDAEKAGIDPKKFADIAFMALPIGLLGARLAHIIFYSQFYSWSDPFGWIAVWKGGLVFQGGPPMALIYAVYVLRKHQIPFWTAADIVFPWIALGHGLGRIGCVLKGCCYGAPTDLPWGIRFPKIVDEDKDLITGSPAYLDHLDQFSEITVASTHSLTIHPTQLYSFFGLMTILAIMLLLRKYWKPFTGFTFPVYLIIYSAFRFWVEALRGDHNPQYVMDLSLQQIFCLIGIIVGIVGFFVLRTYQRKHAEAPKTPQSND
jgi:phosphatidylglycerol:prolipoprotein diacylglycerol transferase